MMLELTGKKSRITSNLHRQTDPYETDAFIDATDDTRLLLHVGVPLNLLQHAVDLYRSGEYHKTVRNWLEHFTDDIYRPQMNAGNDPSLAGRGLALWGPIGEGKTTMAAAILLQVMRMKVENIDPIGHNKVWAGAVMAKFLDWQDTCALLRRAAGGDSEAQEQAEHLWIGRTALDHGDLLVIDDISRERYSEFSANELHRVLRDRFEGGWPTIITTNYAPDEWIGAHGEVLGRYMKRIFQAVEVK